MALANVYNSGFLETKHKNARNSQTAVDSRCRLQRAEPIISIRINLKQSLLLII